MDAIHDNPYLTRVRGWNGAAGAVPEVGTSLPRADAWAKVTGAERYAADYYGPNLVWAGAKRAGVPHAQVRGIHVDEARRIPGVLAVLTHADVKGTNRQGVVRKDQPVLVDDKVRHCGDAVALVLAGDRDTLKKALEKVVLDLEPLPAVFDPEEALRPDAPILHEDHSTGNLLLKADLETGEGLKGFSQCDVEVEHDFQTPWQEHAYLETEVGWARVEEDGTLIIVASTQTPFRDRSEAAEALGLDIQKARVVAPFPGGAFGGKDGITVQTLLGLAALHAEGRPVKMSWDREESFVAGTKRHPARLHYRLGATKDGILKVLEVRMLFDTGPYDHLGGVVMTLALEHAGGPYRIPNTSLSARCAYTNNPIGGAFRAFGVAQAAGAMEQMMDLLARRLALDPVEIRLKNVLHKGDKTPVGVVLQHSIGMEECLTALARHPLYLDREKWKARAGTFKRRGVGAAALMLGIGYGPVVPDVANAKLRLTRKGRIRIYSGVVDMGQGNAATCLQIAGSILSQTPDTLELVLPDTERTLPSGSAAASRTTYTFGNALIGACQALKQRLLEKAADLLMTASVEEVVMEPGMVRHLASSREIPLAGLAAFMAESERTVTHRFRAPTAPDKLAVSEDVRIHGLGHTVFSYAAHLACVEVDELTGGVDVRHYLSISDCGRVINPQAYEQQIQGSVAQGMGYAVMEDFKVRDGQVQTRDLATYILPTAMDVPDMDVVAVQTHETTGPFGLKGVGEIGTSGPVPAIANAVTDAVGVRLSCWPLTPERVLEAMGRLSPETRSPERGTGSKSGFHPVL
ncbi:MAG: xanthine dehydrogenase family protein molybdopterin-binding subunit [Candidatus Desulfacyla sp.]